MNPMNFDSVLIIHNHGLLSSLRISAIKHFSLIIGNNFISLTYFSDSTIVQPIDRFA